MTYLLPSTPNFLNHGVVDGVVQVARDAGAVVAAEVRGNEGAAGEFSFQAVAGDDVEMHMKVDVHQHLFLYTFQGTVEMRGYFISLYAY